MPAPRRFHSRTKTPSVAQRKARLVLFLTRARDPSAFTDEQLAHQHQLAVEEVRAMRAADLFNKERENG
jgi:hypothetical protein